MAHPLQRDFWAGWPAVIVAGYFGLGLIAVDGMTLVEKVVGGLGGGVVLVLVYWTIALVLKRLFASQQPPQSQPKPIDE